MLPTAGYFRTLLCPFYIEEKSCRRPYCHYKHDESVRLAKSNNKSVSKGTSSYKPTPISVLEKNAVHEEVASYEPTPIKKIKHDVVSSIIQSSDNNEPTFENHKSKHGNKRKSSDSKHDKERKRSRSDNEEKSSSKKSSDDKHKKKSSSSKEKTKKPVDINDSVMSFLDEMDKIDKKLEKASSPKKKKSNEDSFLSEISRPDKLLSKKTSGDEEDSRPKKARVSSVKSSDSGLSSTSIARKRQTNNPVSAMLNRFNKARVESQTKDLEDQLSLITGEETVPKASTSKNEPLEGLRKGRVSRTAHAVTNVTSLRRPVVTTESKVPNNVRQKYLDTITDECLKIYLNNVASAYKRAEDEEKICSDKSKNRAVYLNSVVNCIKKLRNEAKEANNGKRIAIPPVQKSITPNMLTTHMQTLLGKAGTRGSWSIEHNDKSLPEMTSDMFFKFLSRYVLTNEQLEEHKYPVPVNLTKAFDEGKFDLTERTCDRCSKRYRVNEDGKQIDDKECVFHWARLQRRRGNRATGFLNIYPCCSGEPQSDGCSVNPYHITNDVDPRGFVKTIVSSDKSKEKVFALDCEMCYTTRGIELTRVTVINDDGDSVYETFVKPDNLILDYNTRFSGIVENDLKNVKTTIRDVQAVLLSMFSSSTILCGHSLDSDLKALKLIHTSVVDTSVVFPHKLGLPYKRALRNLTSEYLQRIIQEDVGGHDSKEDALAALDLMKFKVKQDMKRL